MKIKLMVLSVLLLSEISHAALTVRHSSLGANRHGRKVVASWVANSDGTFTAEEVQLGGLVVKVVTNPGTAPTALYDIACTDPSDTALDVFESKLANRSATTTEQVYPVAASATAPIYAAACTLQITGNSVNAAAGTVEFYVLNP